MKRVKIQIRLQDNFNEPENQVEILKTLDVIKKWFLTPSKERTGMRTLIYRIVELEKELTKTEKYVNVRHAYRIEYNPGIGFSELLIEGKNECVFDRATGINVLSFVKNEYYQDMIELYIKYKGQDDGSCISGAGVINNQNGQVLCGQICQGSVTNQLYFKEACEIIKKHTNYDPEILPGRMD